MHFGIPLPIDVSKCQLTEIGTFYIFEAHIENGLETSCLLLRFKTSKALVLQTLGNLHQKSAVHKTRTLERFPLCQVVYCCVHCVASKASNFWSGGASLINSAHQKSHLASDLWHLWLRCWAGLARPREKTKKRRQQKRERRNMGRSKTIKDG